MNNLRGNRVLLKYAGLRELSGQVLAWMPHLYGAVAQKDGTTREVQARNGHPVERPVDNRSDVGEHTPTSLSFPVTDS